MTAPAATDFSDVYAYPNPVKPDYTGWISIVNLMDNSLVKIADASGNVVYSCRSNGGMFTWDGCNASGSRVKAVSIMSSPRIATEPRATAMLSRKSS